MATHIFFSWQADTPKSTGRNFLRQLLEEVRDELAGDGELDEAMRDLAIDSDTQGVAGQPPIAETILKKIDAAAVFVSDMTFTATRIDGRPSPNPNVLIEYGWALKALGHSRVISVMNIAFGKPSAENLPFDLAHLRWPLQYDLASKASPEIKAAEKKKLKRELKAAIQSSISTVPVPTVNMRAFPSATAKDGPARFRGPNEALGVDEDIFNGTNREVFLSQGAAMWLRLMPTTPPERRWKISELKDFGMQDSNLFPLRLRAGGYSYLRASDGFGVYPVRHDNRDKPTQTTPSVGFAFRAGEVWSIDTSLFAYAADRLHYVEIRKALVAGAERYRRFLLAIGATAPFQWKVGLVGIKGRQLVYPPRPNHMRIEDGGPVCLMDTIECEGLLEENDSTAQVLKPFFERLFEECGVDFPDYLTD